METKTLQRPVFRVSAIKRMFQRDIADGDLRYVLATGKTVREYQAGRSFPIRTAAASPRSRSIRVVIAEDPTAGEGIILTAFPQDQEAL
jgi:hypothetical protein